MAVIMPRDLILFIILVFGPATATDIIAVFQSFYGNSAFTLSALRQRLFVLIHGGYIKSRIYRINGKLPFALYCLTQSAVDVLTQTGRHIEGARTSFPSATTTAHDQVVIKVLRRIHVESIDKNYKYEFLHENILKRRAESQHKSTRGHVFPDLEVIVNSTQVEIIEVDMGTMPVAQVAIKISKLASQEHLTIVMCQSGQRIERLRDALTRTPLTVFKKAGNVLFCLIQDFLQLGFSGTVYMSITGQKKKMKIK